MEAKMISFDEVFRMWMEAEVKPVEGRNLLSLAKTKGFNSITEWRLNHAIKMGLDSLHWQLEEITDPEVILPKIIIGPYKGWSIFFDNKLNTSFAQAMEIPEFFEWCKTHDRIIPISNKFPLPTSFILLRKNNGDLVHIEGGHRICAVVYKQKLGEPIQLESHPPITAAIANVSDEYIERLQGLIAQGTEK